MIGNTDILVGQCQESKQDEASFPYLVAYIFHECLENMCSCVYEQHVFTAKEQWTLFPMKFCSMRATEDNAFP